VLANPPQPAPPGSSASQAEVLCRDGVRLHEQRIRDLESATAYDRKLVTDLKSHIDAREKDAANKEAFAQRLRTTAATADADKKAAFIEFATWLENEAKTDKRMAGERRDALKIIERQLKETEGAIESLRKAIVRRRAACKI
jgi:hypothetical protein